MLKYHVYIKVYILKYRIHMCFHILKYHEVIHFTICPLCPPHVPVTDPQDQTMGGGHCGEGILKDGAFGGPHYGQTERSW